MATDRIKTWEEMLDTQDPSNLERLVLQCICRLQTHYKEDTMEEIYNMQCADFLQVSLHRNNE